MQAIAELPPRWIYDASVPVRDPKSDPVVSIIIPTYNSIKTLDRAIQSVIKQSFLSIELCIVDNASDDGSLEIIKAYVNEYPYIKYISEPDKGIYDAMNKGTEMASGVWVLYLGSDDMLYSRNVISEMIDRASNADMIYGNIINGRGKTANGEVGRYGLLKTNIPHQAILYRRERIHQFQGYTLKYKIRADNLMNIKFLTNDILNVKYIHNVISYFSGDGISSSMIDKDFVRDSDKIYLRYYRKYMTEKEIYSNMTYDTFLHLNQVSLMKGIWLLYKSGKLLGSLRHIAFAVLYRLGLKRV